MKKTIKIFITFIISIGFTLSIGYAGCESLIIKQIIHDNEYSVGANPIINITIQNPSTTVCNQAQTEGFISCIRNGITIFQSNAMPVFVLNPGSEILAGNLKLSNSVSQEKGEKFISCGLNVNLVSSSKSFQINVIDGNRFDSALNKSIAHIRPNLDAAEGAMGVQGLQNFVFKKVMNVIFPIILIVGLLTAMIGFYKLLFSEGEEASKDGFKFITYGVLGIIIIISARYLSSVLFNDIFASGNMTTMSPVDIAQQMYDKIIFPFIKIAIYLVVGYLFISLAFRVFIFITSTDDSIKKKAGGIILRNIIAMLIIIASKQIIEAIYGKKSQVLNPNAQNLGEIGSGILADKNIPILYTVINWILGLATAIILIIIIIQSLQLLLKPDDPDKIQKIKKSIIYIFIGVLIIGAGYILTNVLIVN